MHLYSATRREDAHRFYEREGMSKSGFHFMEKLTPDKVLQPMSSCDTLFLG